MADSFEEKKRGQAFALYGLVAVLAPSLGPTIGGWITDNYSWRWIFYINLPVGILAFFLVSRLVQDPPWIKADRANLRKLDYIGLGLLTVAMGGMQIMLDKGEENDWFASNFIRIFCLLFVAGMTGLIWWQWRAKNPIMNLRLFKYKNFAICCFLMILVGGVLNAATVLEPQFLQQLMGYTATRAGEALAGGGLALLIVMPLAGVATGRFPARNMAAFGFVCFACAFYYTSTHFTLTMTFGFASWLRILQMFAIPFAFIAITTAAYVGLPKEASNQVSGIINFVRNVGGSIFIAITGAIVTNRSLFHQARLQESMQSSTSFATLAAVSSLPSLERSSPSVLSSTRRACRSPCSPAIPPSSIRSTRLPLTLAVAAKDPDPTSWHELPFISNSISRLLRRLIRTSTACSVGWQWAWWCAPSF